jgi:DNA topoisomerase IB
MSRARVREVDCNGPGIRRRGAGRGFTYRDEEGRKVDDPDVLERIRALAVPPAWTDVWICSDPLGHIQATGLDAKGRRQYRYHERWQAERAAEKFERVLRFARQLPSLREQVARDLALEGMPRERVLASAVRLLEVGCFRVGGESYASENGSYGLATIRKDHVKVRRGVLLFDFDAKSGQHLRRAVVDPDVLDVIATLRRRRSPHDAELLAYREDGRWIDVRSDDINDYLHQHIGEEFSAKDFRTWVATVLTAVVLADRERPASATARRRLVKEAVTEVADHLGNTPAVARSAYIDPRVVQRFDEADDTIARALRSADLDRIERAVRRLIARAAA